MPLQPRLTLAPGQGLSLLGCPHTLGFSKSDARSSCIPAASGTHPALRIGCCLDHAPQRGPHHSNGQCLVLGKAKKTPLFIYKAQIHIQFINIYAVYLWC